MDPNILAALIGGGATILAALIGVLAVMLSRPKHTNPLPPGSNDMAPQTGKRGAQTPSIPHQGVTDFWLQYQRLV